MGVATPPLIHSVFSTFKVGGPQRRFAAFANHFGNQFRHLITATDDSYDAQALLDSTLDAKRLQFPESKQGLVTSYPAARRLLKTWKPDVLVTNNWGAIEWAAANVPKLVRHVHIEDGFGPDESERQMPRRVWFRRMALTWHSTVILPSQTLYSIARDVWRLPKSRLVYVPNGIACDKYRAAPDAALVGRILGRGPIIGTIAALRPEKALDRLIRAFQIVRAQRPARLAIVGEGRERQGLEQLVHAHGLSSDVTFIGHLDRPEMILGAFDIFALSSNTEQMPLTVLEAMAAGLPVAGVGVGDVRTMVSQTNRPYIVDRTDEALAGAINALLDAPEQAKGIGADNQAHVKSEYDQYKMFDAYERLLRGAPLT